jgi:hypothetical protein
MRSELAVELESERIDRDARIEEYKCVCAFMRQHATLRFYQLALLLGTTGSIVTALSSQAVRSSALRLDLLKGGGLLVALALLVMEYRSSTYWHSLRQRGNELAASLAFHRFSSSSRWSLLTTSGVGFYLHALIAALWLASLFLRPDSFN